MSPNPPPAEPQHPGNPEPSAEVPNSSLPDADQLPPVKPPSAGFIVQLFLVPGLIVLVIVGVWALFGRLASGEQDWRKLTAELASTNEHRRWRAANGLAQMLRADAEEQGGSGELSRNPQIASALASLLREQLNRTSQREDDLNHQSFLVTTMAFLDVPQTVIPALRDAMQPGRDREVRKNAVRSVAVIAGRSREQDRPLPESPELKEDIIAVSREDDPLFRQLGAYTLGLLPGEVTRDRLEVMVDDPDPNTRTNAAIGLARQDSTAGLPVFTEILTEAAQPGKAPAANDPEAQEREFEQFVSLKNSLKALDELQGEMTAEESREVVTLLRPIAEGYRHPEIQKEARRVLLSLESPADHKSPADGK